MLVVAARSSISSSISRVSSSGVCSLHRSVACTRFAVCVYSGMPTTTSTRDCTEGYRGSANRQLLSFIHLTLPYIDAVEQRSKLLLMLSIAHGTIAAFAQELHSDAMQAAAAATLSRMNR
jgi:hypothetical protein